MLLPRALATIIVVSAIALSSCGGDSEDGDKGMADNDTSASPDLTDVSATDDGGGSEGTSPSFADCSAVPGAEMAVALGGSTGTQEVIPGGGVCTYALDDPQQPSTSVEQFSTADFADGWDGARANIATTAVGTIEGTPVEVPGIGDGAVIVVGTGDGAVPDGIGLVLLGDTIVRATMYKGSAEVDDAELTAITTAVLTLIASKA
ncbi:hypothetical protein [Nocardioides stalactiti]|uniref:hypothetical protein n=1 Tax=Nocardioides stalactiti TaxID=2755356 RepID=UPI0015FF14A4|nr:hypothetical protein [Nocardioides stalactiti]